MSRRRSKIGGSRNWDPMDHPRDKRTGRFTKSQTSRMTPTDNLRTREVLSKFRPPRETPASPAGFGGGRPNAAFNRYRAGGWQDTNRALRAGDTPAGVREMDAAMRPTHADMIVSRQMPLDRFGGVDMSRMTGRTVTDAAYVNAQTSTLTRDPNAGAVMNIAVPRGTPAIVDPATGDVTLPRNTRLAITATRQTEGGTWVVSAAVIDAPAGPAGGEVRSGSLRDLSTMDDDQLSRYEMALATDDSGADHSAELARVRTVQAERGTATPAGPASGVVRAGSARDLSTMTDDQLMNYEMALATDDSDMDHREELARVRAAQAERKSNTGQAMADAGATGGQAASENPTPGATRADMRRGDQVTSGGRLMEVTGEETRNGQRGFRVRALSDQETGAGGNTSWYPADQLEAANAGDWSYDVNANRYRRNRAGGGAPAAPAAASNPDGPAARAQAARNAAVDRLRDRAEQESADAGGPAPAAPPETASTPAPATPSGQAETDEQRAQLADQIGLRMPAGRVGEAFDDQEMQRALVARRAAPLADRAEHDRAVLAAAQNVTDRYADRQGNEAASNVTRDLWRDGAIDALRDPQVLQAIDNYRAAERARVAGMLDLDPHGDWSERIKARQRERGEEATRARQRVRDAVNASRDRRIARTRGLEQADGDDRYAAQIREPLELSEARRIAENIVLPSAANPTHSREVNAAHDAERAAMVEERAHAMVSESIDASLDRNRAGVYVRPEATVAQADAVRTRAMQIAGQRDQAQQRAAEAAARRLEAGRAVGEAEKRAAEQERENMGAFMQGYREAVANNPHTETGPERAARDKQVKKEAKAQHNLGNDRQIREAPASVRSASESIIRHEQRLDAMRTRRESYAFQRAALRQQLDRNGGSLTDNNRIRLMDDMRRADEHIAAADREREAEERALAEEVQRLNDARAPLNTDGLTDMQIAALRQLDDDPDRQKEVAERLRASNAPHPFAQQSGHSLAERLEGLPDIARERAAGLPPERVSGIVASSVSGNYTNTGSGHSFATVYAEQFGDQRSQLGNVMDSQGGNYVDGFSVGGGRWVRVQPIGRDRDGDWSYVWVDPNMTRIGGSGTVNNTATTTPPVPAARRTPPAAAAAPADVLNPDAPIPGSVPRIPASLTAGERVSISGGVSPSGARVNATGTVTGPPRPGQYGQTVVPFRNDNGDQLDVTIGSNASARTIPSAPAPVAAPAAPAAGAPAAPARAGKPMPDPKSTELRERLANFSDTEQAELRAAAQEARDREGITAAGAWRGVIEQAEQDRLSGTGRYARRSNADARAAAAASGAPEPAPAPASAAPTSGRLGSEVPVAPRGLDNRPPAEQLDAIEAFTADDWQNLSNAELRWAHTRLSSMANMGRNGEFSRQGGWTPSHVSRASAADRAYYREFKRRQQAEPRAGGGTPAAPAGSQPPTQGLRDRLATFPQEDQDRIREQAERMQSRGSAASTAWRTLIQEEEHARDNGLGAFGAGRSSAPSSANPAGGAAPAAPTAANAARATTGGADIGTPGQPLSDAQFQNRARMVEEAIGAARKTHATERTHTTAGGAWNPDRARQHREIVDELYARSAHVPRERRAVVAGGLGGAGKTTVLTGHAGIDPSEYVTINPDDIKEIMAERGMVPDVPGHPDLSPMERAALVHEESSTIASMLADRALRDGRNIMYDITMSSGSSVQARMDLMRSHGYSEIQGVFVDIPVEVSVSRAMSRYRRGAEKRLSGKGHGGRYVPPAIIRAQESAGGRTINRDVFDGMSGQFSNWAVYDNSVDGRAPQLVNRSSGPSKKAFDADAAAQHIREARTLAEMRERVHGMTKAQLREIAKANGIGFGAAYTAERLRIAVGEGLVGARLDSEAIRRSVAERR